MINTSPESRMRSMIGWLLVVVVLTLTGVALVKAEDQTSGPSSATSTRTAVPITGDHNDDALEQSLIEAWERVQKNHLKTMTFERFESGESGDPGVYRFHTKRFPFDGRLRVLNVAVGDQHRWAGVESPVMGVVEVMLEDLPEDFMTHYAQSYSMWQQTNMLYHDPRTGHWVTMDEYPNLVEQTVDDSWGGGGWGCVLSGSGNLFWILFLVFIVILLLVLSRNASKSIKRTMAAQDKVIAEQERAMRLTEKAVEISQDSNRVLKEILDAVKQSDRPRMLFGKLLGTRIYTTS